MELNGSTELLRNTIDSSMDMIQVFEAIRNDQNDIVDFIWILNNKASERIYGDVIGKSLLTLNPGVIEEGIFDTFKKVVETGEPDQSIRHYVHEQFNGWFHQSTVKLKNGVTTTTRDITAQKKAEQDLSRSHLMLQSIIDGSLDIVQVFEAVRDETNKIIDFKWTIQNQKGFQQNGNVIGKSLIQQNPGFLVTGLFDKFIQVTENGIPIEQEVYYEHEQFKGWFHQTLVKLNGGFVMTTKDITSRKEAELELKVSKNLVQTVFDVSLNPIAYHKAVRDVSGKIIDFEFQLENREARKYAAEDRTGKLYSEAYPGIKDTEIFNLYRNVVETGNTLNKEVRLSLKGSEHWFQLMGVKLDDGLVATVLDVTERKKIEQEILSLKDEIARKAETELAKELAATKLLQNVSSRLLETDETQALYDEIIMVSKAIMNSDAVSMQMFIPETKQLKLIASHGFHPDAEKFWDLVEVGSGSTCGEALAKNERIVVSDVENATFMQGTADLENYRLCGIRAVQSTPLVSRAGSIVGMISNHWYHVHEPSVRDFNLLDVLARQLADHFENSHTQDSLRRSEEKYRTVFETMEEGFCIIEFIDDAEGQAIDFRMIEVNKAYESASGLKDVRGKRLSEIAPGIERYWIDFYDNVARTGVPHSMENYSGPLDRWFAVKVTRVGGAESRQVAIIFQNITERKRRESNQAFLVEITDVLQRLTQPEEITQAVGSRVGEYLNLSSCLFVDVDDERNEVTVHYGWEKDGGPRLKQQTFRLSDYLTEEFARACRAGETVVIRDTANDPRADAEAYARIKVGSYVVVPFHREGRWVAHLVLLNEAPCEWREDEIELGKNITDRVFPRIERARAEEALRKSEQQLKRLLRLRDEFIGVASHELKTPVTSMKAYAEIVKERLERIGNAEDSELLERLNTQVDRLTALINDLLDTTKISEGQLQLTIQQVDVNLLLQETLGDLRRTSGHNFELNIEKLQPVMADRERIRQVIINLLSNAIKYSPKETTIMITAANNEHGIKVSVRDEGLGIPEEDQQKIFDRFYRVTTNNQDTYPGMGLGLYISAQIIQRLGGTIDVQSKTGKGSTFTFTLPYSNTTL